MFTIELKYKDPPRGFGEQANKVIYLRGTREQNAKNEETGVQRQFLGTMNIDNQGFVLGNKGKCRFISGKQGNRYPLPPGRASVHIHKKKLLKVVVP